MAIHRDALIDLFDANAGFTELGFRRILHGAEPQDAFASDENWDALCSFALEVDREFDFSEDFQRAFTEGESPNEALNDNFVLAAVALVQKKACLGFPVMAWAAFNKHAYPGAKDTRGFAEASVMRLLHWGGAGIDVAEDRTGMTALHYMSSTRHGEGSDPRIVNWLLGHGANPNVRNKNGDTPLAYLCGNEGWSAAHHATFQALIAAGADPCSVSTDGSTPLSLLRKNDLVRPCVARQDLIARLAA